MFRRMIFLFCCVALSCSLFGCFAHPYVGKSLSRSFPHNKYDEMPTKNILCITSSNGDKVYFNYTLTKNGNEYTIEGTMNPELRVQSYPDITLYLILVNRGTIVESIRLNTLTSVSTSDVKFSKTFTTEEEFKFITFFYNFKYNS